jgi:hypothetical protein
MQGIRGTGTQNINTLSHHKYGRRWQTWRYCKDKVLNCSDQEKPYRHAHAGKCMYVDLVIEYNVRRVACPAQASTYRNGNAID